MHWDLIRQWIGSLGPVVALGAAVVPYWRNSKDRRREQATHLYCGHSVKYEFALPGDGMPDGRPQRDGVRVVGIMPEGSLLSRESLALADRPDADLSLARFTVPGFAEVVKVDLSSTSDEPFFNIAVWVTGKDGNDTLATAVPQLEPKGKLRHYVYFDPGTLPATPLHIRFEFQDANGRSWQRISSDPVRHLRHLTPIKNLGSLPGHILVPIQPRPDFYSPEPRVWHSMRADEIADMLAAGSTPAELYGGTTTPNAEGTL